MSDFIQNFQDFWQIVVCTLLIFGILAFIFRHHILHVLDPLVFYLVTQAFTIELAFLILDDPKYLINFLGCQLFFLGGFFLLAGKGLTKEDKKNARLLYKTPSIETSFIKWYAVFAAILLLLANVAQMKATGIVLLSDNPSEAKVTNFTAGGGIVRRLDWGMIYICGLFLVAMFFLRKKLKYLAILFLLLFVLALGGSKGALFYFVMLISLLGCFADIRKNSVFKLAQTGGIVLLILAFVLAGFIVHFSNSAQGINDVLFSLAGRMLFYGDSMIYYYNKESVAYFSHYNALNYFADDFNSVLGSLRIVPYSEQLGYKLINYYYNTNSTTFGPSIGYYVKGNIYFGYYGAFFYSFVIGSIVGFVRKRFYKIVRKPSSSLLYSLLIIHLNMMIYTLAQDSPVFISTLFDTVFLSVPVIFFVLYLQVTNKPLAVS